MFFREAYTDFRINARNSDVVTWLLGHTYDSFDLLYEKDEDDGKWQWGSKLHVELYQRGQEGGGKSMHDQEKHESNGSRRKASTPGGIKGSSKTTSSNKLC